MALFEFWSRLILGQSFSFQGRNTDFLKAAAVVTGIFILLLMLGVQSISYNELGFCVNSER